MPELPQLPGLQVYHSENFDQVLVIFPDGKTEAITIPLSILMDCNLEAVVRGLWRICVERTEKWVG